MLNAVNAHLASVADAAPQTSALPLSQSSVLLGLALASIEACLAALVILSAFARTGSELDIIQIGCAGSLGAGLVMLLQAMRGYDFVSLRQPERVLPQLLGLGALCMAAGMAVIGALAAQQPIPMHNVLLAVGIFSLAVAALRILLAVSLQWAEQSGGLRHRVAVLDLTPPGIVLDRRRLAEQIETQRGFRCVVEVVAPDGDTAEWPSVVVETVRWAEEILVVVVPRVTAATTLERLLEALEVVPVPVGIAVPFEPSSLGFAITRMHEAPLGPVKRGVKRLLDIVVACLMLIFLGPLLIAVGIAVKLDSPGPVFFRQVRRGYNNRRFDALKFRSLRNDMSDPLANRLVTKDDPRVTKVGAFLRRSSIDELPQLFNVLKGDMSLVGPRPHALNAKAGGRPYEEVVERFQRRYRVRPGITGWAQVNGLRGNTETEDDLLRRVDFDLDYIHRWSIWLDIIILLRTPLVTLKGENAL